MTDWSLDATHRFLLLCLRSRRDPSLWPEIEEAIQDRAVEWTEVAAVAEGELIAPLLYAALRERRLLPEAVESGLRRQYEDHALRNTTLLHELSQLLALLDRAGLPAIVLKGAALAEGVYENVALRPMGDVDILLRRNDVTAALDVLKKEGFKRQQPEEGQGMALRFENEAGFYKSWHVETFVDVHWNLIDSQYHQRQLDVEWFWQTATPGYVSGRPARFLSAEAQLLHLSAHATLHHEGTELLWLHDIYELLHAHPELAWDEAMRRAQAFGLVLPLRQALGILRDHWRLGLPPGVWEQMQATLPTSTEAAVFRRLRAPDRPVARRFGDDLTMLDGWRARLRFAAGHLFPSAGYMRYRYDIESNWLLPLYYPYRWYLGLRSTLRVLLRP